MDKCLRPLQIPGEDGAVIASGPERVAVGAEGERVDAGGVTLVVGPVSGGQVPDHHHVVIGPRCELGSVRAERQTDEPLTMPGECSAALPARQIEHADDGSLFHIGRRRQCRSVATDSDRGVRAVDLADLLP